MIRSFTISDDLEVTQEAGLKIRLAYGKCNAKVNEEKMIVFKSEQGTSSCFSESYNLPSFKSKINQLDLIYLSD